MATNKRDNTVKNDERIAIVETTINHINVTLDEIKKSLVKIDSKLDSRFDHLNSKIDSLNDKVDSRFDKVHDRIWTQFYWMIGGFASIAAVIAHGFHWI